VAHADRALGRLAHTREGLGQQVVERFTLCRPLAELLGLGPQLRIAQGLECRLKRVDPLDHSL
jgi:hypothetical protein